MHLRFLDPYIRCDCGKPNFLPHQNPSETNQGLDNPPTVAFPLIFLCIPCGRVTVHSDYRDDDATQPGRLPDLWQIECECDQENCGMLQAIYIACSRAFLEAELRQLLVRRDVGV